MRFGAAASSDGRRNLEKTMMYGFGMGNGWFGMGLWWIVVVATVVWVAWMVGRGRDGTVRSESARELLNKRYARGEIGRDEYEQKKRDIGP
jgi:putative membrane protein